MASSVAPAAARPQPPPQPEMKPSTEIKTEIKTETKTQREAPSGSVPAVPLAQLARGERIDLQSLRAKIRAALGKDRAAPYFELLRKYISAQLTKRELDVHAATLLQNGWEAADSASGPSSSSRSDFIALHNLFIKAILHNAACSEGPPLPPTSSFAPRGVMEYGLPRPLALNVAQRAGGIMSVPGTTTHVLPAAQPLVQQPLGAPPHVTSSQTPQVSSQTLSQTQAPTSHVSKRSSSSGSTKSSKAKREKKSKKNKKSKKSGAVSGQSSSSRNIPSSSTAAHQAAALIAARQEQMEHASRLQQAQQAAQQAAAAAAAAAIDQGVGVIPLSVGERKLFGSRPDVMRHKIAQQTRTHAIIRQHMQMVVAEFAATVQAPGVLRDYQESLRSDGTSVDTDDLEPLLAHVSNDAVVLVHDALQIYIRGVLQQLAVSTELRTGVKRSGDRRARHENVAVFGGAVIIQTDTLSEEDDEMTDGDEPVRERRRQKTEHDDQLIVSLPHLQHMAARDPCAQRLFQDDRERLLERVSLLL